MKRREWSSIEYGRGEAELWEPAIEGILAQGASLQALDPWLMRLDQGLLDRLTRVGSGEGRGRFLAAWITAMLLRRPDAPSLERIAAEGYRNLLTPMEPEERSRLGQALLLHGLLCGGRGRVALVAGALWGGVGRHAVLESEVVAHLGDAVHAWARGRSHDAREAVRTGLKVAAAEGGEPWRWWLHLVGAAVALGRGEVAEADRWLRLLPSGVRGLREIDLALYHLLLAWRGVVDGERAATVEAAEVAEVLGDEVGVVWFPWAARLLQAISLAQRGERAEGLRRMAALRPLAEHLPAPLVTVSTKLAEAHVAPGEKERREALARGLVAARSHGMRIWLGQPPAVAAELMATALRERVEEDEARRWVRGWELPAPSPPLRVAAWPWPVRVESLGRFRVVRWGKPLPLESSGQRRPLDLLRALLACGGREVRRERLADLLWPEADGDAASRVLATTLHRLRRLLGEGVVIRPREGMVGLDPHRCWVDIWALEEGVGAILEQRRGIGERERVAEAERAIALYRGPLLRATGGESWLLAPRERLHVRVMRAVERVAAFWEEGGELARAIAVYERGLEIDNLEEGLYQGVIRCWLSLDRRSKALVAYRRCKDALAEGLGVEPSPATVALLRQSTPLPRKRLHLPHRRR